jgi:hypothetical protein
MLEDYVNFLEATGFHGVRERIRVAVFPATIGFLDDDWSGKFFDPEED